MKRPGGISPHRTTLLFCMISAILAVNTFRIYAQEKRSVTGRLVDIKSSQAVAFASVALLKSSDSSPAGGTLSDENGVFLISPAPTGNYKLFISIIGYKPVTQNINVINPGVLDAGTILLQDTSIMIKETMVIGERVKARTETDKTTFFMTKKMLDASANSMDLLKLIPGIQVDLMQNISIEGSRNIRILVDGKERDGSFISQINPAQIDRVEVISRPSSNYDGNITGAINIIMKKERDSGISGQVYTEIPTSGSELFLRPSCSLNYGYDKLNLYTSYKGEFTYLDIHEETKRKQFSNEGTFEFNSNQYVYQKNWSHRFNYGFDYFLSEHDQFNFFAFYNPFSRELDGYADSKTSDSTNSYWKAKKEDTDRNQSTFYSLYYKHDFEKEGRALTFEMSNYNLKAENSTEYTPAETGFNQATQVNIVRPQQNEITTKLDYTSPAGNKLSFGTGLKAKYKLLQDRNIQDYNYTEQIFAAYGTVGYKQSKYDISLGARAEQSVSRMEKNFSRTGFSFFPHFNFNYKLNSRQNIQASFNRSIIRPNVYQLNPSVSVDDPYTIIRGNPFLEPEPLNTFFLEHSIQFKSNYFASRAFINIANNAIENLTFINDTNAFETRVSNLGKLNQLGLQFLGTFKVGIVTFNPYFGIYGLHTSGNDLAKQHKVEDKYYLGIDGSLSGILSFSHGFSLSMVFQYESPTNNIQSNTFSGALYFISLEKTFKQKFKLGIVSALPFTKNFIYRGSEVSGSDFQSHYKGYVNVSQPFFWLKMSYQFNSGKKRENINRETDEGINLPKKGF
jgi:outer membrane receptor protein involved in Fe transport